MLWQMQEIFVGIILPILMLAGIGVLLQRWRPMDIPTLAKLNIYLLVPAFLFVRVSESTMTWSEIGGIVAAVLIPTVLIGLTIFAVARPARVPGPTIAAMIVGTVIYNAGNFGVPLALLLYPEGSQPPFEGMRATTDGAAVQALVLMMSNLCIWCFGFILVSVAKGHGLRRAVVNYLKLPLFYALIAALMVRELRSHDYVIPTVITFPLHQLGLAIVPISLITLGAQLAHRAKMPNWRRVSPIVALKLLGMPAATGVTVWLLGLWPWPGVQIVIASSAPTAINTLLVTVELDGDTDLTADAVFATTVVCAVTVTIVIVAMKMLAPAG